MKHSILSRSEVASAVASKTELSPFQVESVLKEFEAAIAARLREGGEVRLPGFGSFKTAARGERQGRNPKTGEAMTLAARTSAKFVPGKSLKDLK